MDKLSCLSKEHLNDREVDLWRTPS